MRYKILGRSGLKVSEICLGTMTFGEDWGWGGSKEESRKMFDAFINAGGNFIDTANNYTNGTAETLVGEFIHPGRGKYVIATKYTLSTNPKDPNNGGNHKKSLVQSLERSLKRLHTDFIDLFWLHAWDNLTPAEEVMRALDDQIRLGKILHIGVSDTPAWVIAKSNTLAELRGWSSFTALQTQYSLIERTSERELLPMCKAFDIAVTAWAPLGRGILTGKYYQNTNEPKRYVTNTRNASVFNLERNKKITEKVIEIAAEIKKSPAQVALRWVLEKNDKNIMIPIIGGRSEKQVIDVLGALGFSLTGDQMNRLEEVSGISLGFPNEFIHSPFVKMLMFGEIGGQIDLLK